MTGQKPAVVRRNRSQNRHNLLNMKNAALLLVCCLLLPFLLSAQFSFTNRSNWLFYPQIKSGAPIAITDMNGDGFDDIVRIDGTQNLKIDYQTPGNNNYTGYTYGQLVGSQWSICIADVDNNGYNDIFTGGGYNGLKLLKSNSIGTAYSLTTISIFPIFLQGSNFADINNDGDIDIFACHDEGVSQAYRNTGTGSFVYDTSLIYPISTVPSDNSGNYGSVWMDYDNDGDQDLYISKCRQGVNNPLDGRRLNLLFQNDGANNFTDVAEQAGLRPLAQSWAADFADIDNDGDLDCFIITHDSPNKLYTNNGFGFFTEITAQSGMLTAMNAAGPGLQVKFEDFDNDGFVDLLYTSLGNNHCLFRNNGNNTFTNFANAFPTPNRIHSASTGDLNNDGFVDVVASFGSGYNTPGTVADVLFINNGNNNYYFKVRLDGVVSNPNGIGARLELYGTWGVQIREVRSGESYGIHTSLTKHFGLGQNPMIDSLVVRWPSGTVDKIVGPSINQTLVVVEGSNCLTTVDFNSAVDDLTVNFTDASSLGATQWLWTFGDGGSSTTENPVHSYSMAGVYQVCLTATGLCGSGQTCKFVNVSCQAPLSVFNYQADNLEVQFNDLSTNQPANWLWNFGDGTSSTDQSPAHTYSQPGIYFVCLIVSNNCGSAQYCEVLNVACAGAQVGYSYTATSLTVQFQDISTGNPTQWSWDFGDGSSSNSQNPQHMYDESGVYQVCLEAVTDCGTLEVCQQITITCTPPAVGISYAALDLAYNFQGIIGGEVNTLIWTFGDGAFSSLYNPSHTYANPGTYEVCLFVTSECGEGQFCTQITASCAPPASGFIATIFEQEATFQDISLGNPTSWTWTFGDGSESNLQNPQHTYQTSGNYEVCLQAASQCGSTQVCQNITINCSAPQSAFAYQTTGLGATFTDNSSNAPTMWNWTFGDGGSSTSPNPLHVYIAPGTYQVCLTVTSLCGSTQSCQNVVVSCAPPASAFGFQSNNLAVSFSDQSANNPASWTWTFGDGAVSGSQNPQHTYSTPGAYQVCLTVASLCGSTQSCQNVTVSCAAPISAFGSQSNNLTVIFNDQSANNPSSWSWNFGDGTTSTSANPQHTYSMPGTYQVCLTASSLCGNTQSCQNITLDCPAPQAAFTFTINGLEVIFNENTENAPSDWVWSFGDGFGDLQPNPSHTYASPGAYLVCLTAENGCGQNQYCEMVTVSCAAPQAGFVAQTQELAVTFTDWSTNDPEYWSWSFGDGATSTLQNPSYTYEVPGEYEVCLMTGSLCGTDTFCVNIEVTCVPSQANFQTIATELAVAFTDLSSNEPVSWQWTFGDGATSTLQSPSHTYTLPGDYLVCLTVGDICGTTQRCELITVSCAPPSADFAINANGLSISCNANTGGNDVQWEWDFGDDNSGAGQSVSHTFETPGEYEICLTLTSPCGVSTQCQSVLVSCAPPEALFSVSGVGLNLIFFDASTNNPDEWLWDFGDGSTSTDQNPFHTYSAPGDYIACMTASSICGSDTNCLTILVVVDDTDQPGSGIYWRLAPNPVAGQLTMEITATEPMPAILTVFDVLGRRVFTKEWRLNEGENRTYFDLINWQPGVYWWSLTTEKGTDVQSLIKQ